MKRKRKGRRGRNAHNPHGPVRKDGADRISIRVVDLLDACPGNRTDTGKPIIMVTVSRADDIETIAFNLRDTNRLAIHLAYPWPHRFLPTTSLAMPAYNSMPWTEIRVFCTSFDALDLFWYWSGPPNPPSAGHG